MSATQVVFVDLSSISHPIWHMSQSEPDPNATSQKIVARVRALAQDQPHVAICCDAGKSFRHELSAAYKANRPESDAPLQHQITLAREQLEADGFPVWAVRGFEADDLIATGVTQALAADLDALIVSADKDLLQLVGPRVRAMSVKDGSIFDEEAVFKKFAVAPWQMRDYLTLVGDASDNVKGAKGIGPVKAASILAKFESLDKLYQALDAAAGQDVGLPTSIDMTLREFQASYPLTRSLITLRTDVTIPFDEIHAPRVSKEAAQFAVDMEDDMDSTEAPDAGAVPQPAAAREPSPSVPHGGDAAQLETALAVREADQILAAPADWERGLDPRSMKDARVLAKDMHDSRMFSAYGSPQGVLSTIMVGRELGLPAMASLRCIYNIEGKHSLSAALMVALVLKSGLAEYFEPISFSEEEATFETQRKGARNPVRLTHTFDMGKKAFPKTKADWEKSFLASGWGRNPTDMVVARAQARLARMVYPDLLAGLYAPEELAEIREAVAA
jgi:5'-3' exonuclease